MNLNYLSLLLVTVLFLYSCNDSTVKEATSEKVDYYKNIPAELKPVFEAHGGLEKWNEMQALTYSFLRGEKDEVQKMDLRNRKARIEGKGYTIGFDGEEVWVAPNKAAYSGSSARFYHNLMFYFYAMPFVLADPGINYEVLPQGEILGKMYNKISITYGSGVGDAPDDEYIICFDPETNKMEWLLYTVTYFSKEKGKKYNALHYNKWQEVNGLLLPETNAGYRTSNDSITEKRYESLFKNVSISTEAFDQSIFEMPSEAEIDSLK